MCLQTLSAYIAGADGESENGELLLAMERGDPLARGYL